MGTGREEDLAVARAELDRAEKIAVEVMEANKLEQGIVSVFKSLSLWESKGEEITPEQRQKLWGYFSALVAQAELTLNKLALCFKERQWMTIGIKARSSWKFYEEAEEVWQKIKFSFLFYSFLFYSFLFLFFSFSFLFKGDLLSSLLFSSLSSLLFFLFSSLLFSSLLSLLSSPLLSSHLPTCRAGGDTVLNEADHLEEVDVLSRLEFGIGLYHFFVSLVPPGLLMIVEAIGFQANRQNGIKYLKSAVEREGIHYATASLLMVGYHNFFMQEVCGFLVDCAVVLVVECPMYFLFLCLSPFFF